MNILSGHIIQIKTEGSLSLIRLMVKKNVLSSIVIDTPDTAEYLKKDNLVKILFKETEVILAKNFTGEISLQNKLNCTVTSFEKGELLCKVNLNYDNCKITSVITRNAFDQLNIQQNDELTAMIKTNEISLSHD